MAHSWSSSWISTQRAVPMRSAIVLLLVELRNTMGQELREIFIFCEGFKSKVTDAASFSAISPAASSRRRCRSMIITPIPPAFRRGRKKSSCGPASRAFSSRGWAVGVAHIALASVAAPPPCAGDCGRRGTGCRHPGGLCRRSWRPAGSRFRARQTSISRACSRRSICADIYPFRDRQPDAGGGHGRGIGANALRRFRGVRSANKPSDIGAPTQAPGVIGI